MSGNEISVSYIWKGVPKGPFFWEGKKLLLFLKIISTSGGQSNYYSFFFSRRM